MQSGAAPAGKIKENPAGQQCSGQGIHDDVGGQSSVPPQSSSILPLLGENQAPGVILVILQSSWSNLYQQNKVQFDEVHLLWPKYFTGKFPFCLPSLSFLQLCERTDTSPPPPPLPPRGLHLLHPCHSLQGRATAQAPDKSISDKSTFSVPLGGSHGLYFSSQTNM